MRRRWFVGAVLAACAFAAALVLRSPAPPAPAPPSAPAPALRAGALPDAPPPGPLVVIVTAATKDAPYAIRSLANKQRYALLHRPRVAFHPVFSWSHLVDVGDAALYPREPDCGVESLDAMPPDPTRTPFGMARKRWNRPDKSHDGRYIGYWVKVGALIEALELYPSAAYVWWLDLDTLITNMTARIDDLIPGLGNGCGGAAAAQADTRGRPDHLPDFVVAEDCNSANTGSFLVRSSPYMFGLLGRVFATLLARTPRDNEQGEFVRLLREDAELRSRTYVVPQKRFNAYPVEIDCQRDRDPWRPGDFIWHIAGAWAMNMFTLFNGTRKGVDDPKAREEVEAYRANFACPGLPKDEWKYRWMFDKYASQVADIPPVAT
ncbi:galactosyl transferase GMA12/MNN10 family-domain-containing protein [Hyaloraphidium curvatum]|nr:galactosyl transferase GMA12/MNN10 family-domain-containing protein [Hyaloraphidium curvatum]